MRSQWNGAEDAALQGLTAEAQIMYLRGFRRYMDFSSGVAGGARRKISYKALAELISVDPDWGSRRTRDDVPSLGRVRARVAELVRAGLVVNHGSSRSAGLVFKLPLADTGLLRPEKEQHRKKHKEPHWEQHRANVFKHPKNREISSVETDRNNTGNNTGSDTRNNTHPVKTTLLNSTDAGARDNEAWPDDFKPQKPTDWGSYLGRERGWAFHRVSKPKLIVMYQRWTELGLTIGDMRHVMASAEANLGRIPDGPEWYRQFAESYATEQHRLSQDIQNQQQRGAHVASPTDSQRRSRRDEQDAVRRQLTDPNYALEQW